MRIVEFRDKVTAAIKAKLPDLKTCQTYGGRFNLEELENRSVHSPAVFVSVLGERENSSNGDGQRVLNLRMAAFVVATDQRGQKRDVVAINLCEILEGWIPHQRFDMEGVADADTVRWDNLYSGKGRKQNVALMAVTWQQRITIGEISEDFPTSDNNPIPETVYLGYVPKIGTGNEPHYEELTADE